MACNISSNIGLDCIDGSGSVVRAFIANGPASSYTATAGNVTAIEVGGVAIGPSDFYTWDVPRQTSSYTETANVSIENGTLNYSKDLTLSFTRMEAAKRNELLLAAQNQDMIIVFEDANGLYWGFGLDKGAYTSAASATTGTAFADKNGYDITLSSIELTPAFTVDSSIVVA